jgi:hypothetical protein
MKRRLSLITEIIAPYRIPVFNALAARDDLDLHVSPCLKQTRPSSIPTNDVCSLGFLFGRRGRRAARAGTLHARFDGLHAL